MKQLHGKKCIKSHRSASHRILSRLFFHPGWTLIQINPARSCTKGHNLTTFRLIHTEKFYNQCWQQGWWFAGEEKGSERGFCGRRFLGTYFTICGSLIALCELRWHGGTIVNIPVFVLQMHNGWDCCIKDKRYATCVCLPSPLHVKGVSCGRVYVTGFVCVSRSHSTFGWVTRLREWVSWLRSGLRGSCLGFTMSQNQKQRGKKMVLEKETNKRFICG